MKTNSLEALKWRYATQKFDPNKIIPPDKIKLLKKAFNLSPTSYGLQPVRMLVIHNKKIQQELVKYTYFQEQVYTASHILLFCTEINIDTKLIENNFELEKKIRNTPEEILLKSKNNRIQIFENWTASERRKWAINQLYLTLGTVLSVCAMERIDACPMEGFEIEKYDTFLGLQEKGITSHLVVPIGYRAKDDIFAGFAKVRRPLEETVWDIS